MIHGLIVPHAPDLIDYEKAGRSSNINATLKTLGADWIQYDGIVAITTHWQPAVMSIDISSPLRCIPNDQVVPHYTSGMPELGRLVAEKLKSVGISVQMMDRGMDHAVSIPLHLADPNGTIPVLPISAARLSHEECFMIGNLIREVIQEQGLNILVLDTGSLGHDLSLYVRNDWSMNDQIKEFDNQVIDFLKNGQGLEVLQIDSDRVELAKPEGNFRDLYLFLGIIGTQTTGNLLAYEMLPGIGMAVISFYA